MCGARNRDVSISAAPLWLWAVGVGASALALVLVSYARGVAVHRTRITLWLSRASTVLFLLGAGAFAITHIVLGSCAN
jgi:hypothetical protein